MQIEIYEDKDNARKDEIAALGGQTATGINVFSAFYDRLKEVVLSFFLFFVFVFRVEIQRSYSMSFSNLRFLNVESYSSKPRSCSVMVEAFVKICIFVSECAL